MKDIKQLNKRIKNLEKELNLAFKSINELSNATKTMLTIQKEMIKRTNWLKKQIRCKKRKSGTKKEIRYVNITKI